MSPPDTSHPTATRPGPTATTDTIHWLPSPPKTASSWVTRAQVTPSGEVHTAASPPPKIASSCGTGVQVSPSGEVHTADGPRHPSQLTERHTNTADSPIRSTARAATSATVGAKKPSAPDRTERRRPGSGTLGHDRTLRASAPGTVASLRVDRDHPSPAPPAAHPNRPPSPLGYRSVLSATRVHTSPPSLPGRVRRSSHRLPRPDTRALIVPTY